MNNLIDFTDCQKRKKSFDGANGSKISILYNNEYYMLKFPPKSIRNKELSYKNDTISEYLGCHILASLDVPVQDTLLGTYSVANKKKVVVACKDFTNSSWNLHSFAAFKNQIVDSEHNGYGTELSDIEKTFETQTEFDPKILKDFFWNTFVCDAFIGNWDRHNGNWGFLYNEDKDILKLAPLYDCGSCLYPTANEKTIECILTNEDELKIRIYERPYSALKIEQKNINYYSFINSLSNENCNNAIKRIYPKIDMQKVQNIVSETPFITPLQKSFYMTMLYNRKTLILEPAYKKLREKEISKSMNREKKKKTISLSNESMER